MSTRLNRCRVGWAAGAALAGLCLAVALVPPAVAARRARPATELRALLERGRGVLVELQALDREISGLEARRLRAERDQEDLRRGVLEAQRLAAQAEQLTTQAWRALRARVLAYQGQSLVARLRLILSAPDSEQALGRARLLRLIARHDRRALERLTQQRERLLALRAGLAERRRQLALVEEGLVAEQQRLAALRLERSQLLALIRASQELRGRIGGELVDASTRLSALVLEQARRQVRAGQGFAALRGRLERPAAGRVERGFGREVDPRFGTLTVHNGIDIVAPAGTPVLAVQRGTLEFCGWVDGYGLLAIVAHGDGYFTVYGHLARCAKAAGEPLAAQELLGLVGETGSLLGPRLYFEIRQHGTPLDPAAWLR